MLAFERLAEEKIRDAIAAGEFDRLPGKGKPLHFDELIGLRPEDRMAHTVLKNSGFLPEHLEWRKELETCLTEAGTKFHIAAWERSECRRHNHPANTGAAPDLP